MQYCTRGVLPPVSPTAAAFDVDDLCSACRVAQQVNRVDWTRRKDLFDELVEDYRPKDGGNYDCIVSVSGGKDSSYQVHIVTKEYGLKPLLGTYHGNNNLPDGERNLQGDQFLGARARRLALADGFRDVLARFGWSSNMWILARRPA